MPASTYGPANPKTETIRAAAADPGVVKSTPTYSMTEGSPGQVAPVAQSFQTVFTDASPKPVKVLPPDSNPNVLSASEAAATAKIGETMLNEQTAILAEQERYRKSVMDNALSAENIQKGADIAQAKVLKDIQPQAENMAASQRSATLTGQAGAVKMGLSGSAQGASMADAASVAHLREQKVFNDKKQQLLNDAWDANLRGMVGTAAKIQMQMDTLEKEKAAAASKAIADQKAALELDKLATDRADSTVTRMLDAGFEPTNEQLSNLDARYGLTEGTSATLYAASSATRAVQDAKDETAKQSAAVDAAKKLNDYLDSVPTGQKVTIGGVDYYGTGKGSLKTGIEVDKATGKGLYWEYDPATGKTTTTPMGTVGFEDTETGSWSTQTDDNGNLWRVNATTNQMAPMTPSEAQKSWEQVIPDGSVWQRNGVPAPQCGAFANDLVGCGVGDTYESKMAKTDPSIKAGTENPPQVGDFFVQKLGSWTGHVGIVSAVNTAPNGKVTITALESNYPKPGVVSSTRIVPVESINGFGRTGRISEQLKTGPDAPPPVQPVASAPPASSPTFGNKKKSDLTPGETFGDSLLNNEIKLLEIPAAAREEALAYAKKKGYKPAGNSSFAKISESAKTDFAELLTMDDQIRTMEDLYYGEGGKEGDTSLDTGPFSAATNAIRGWINVGNQELMDLDAKAEDLKSNVMKSRSGAAVSENEVKRLAKFLPATSENDQAFRTKLQHLRDNYDQMMNTKAKLYGFKDIADFKKQFGIGTAETSSKPSEAPPAGQVWVKDNATGAVGSMPQSEVDAKSYTIL
jgi:hypothetical protein